ncbi:MAG: hypothetical protein U5P10_00060 [Spirochaetia bacterium]|nr:hypothetical protein [Spirochaetia bacterium]
MGSTFTVFFNQIIPLFREIPDDPEFMVDSSFLLRGMTERTQIEIAREYKKSADILVGEAIGPSLVHPQEMGCSILSLYRHAIRTCYLRIDEWIASYKGKKNSAQ